MVPEELSKHCQTFCRYHRTSENLFEITLWDHQQMKKVINSLSPSDPYICISKTCQHCFRYWLLACSVPSHYLNQCWDIVNCTLGNKFQWNFNKNTTIFIEENNFENVVWKMVAILFQLQHINTVSADGLAWLDARRTSASTVMTKSRSCLTHWPLGNLNEILGT